MIFSVIPGLMVFLIGSVEKVVDGSGVRNL